MAQLPIPDFGLTTTEAPRSSVTGDVFRQPQQASIAPGLNALAEGTDALARDAAEAKAREDLKKSVVRNEDGSVSVATPDNNFILGNAGKAYQRVFEQGSLSALQNQNAQALTEMRQQFPLDPQGFQKAAGAYIDKLRSQYPGALGEAAYENAARMATQHYDGLVNAKAKQDVDNSYQEITTRISSLKNDMLQIARQDGTETEAFGNSAGMLKAQYDALVANPKFGITREKANYELDNFRKEAADQYVIGKVRQVRDNEGADAARAWAEKEIRDKKGGVPAENDARFNMALGEIGRLTDAQRANAASAKADSDAMVQLFHAGKPPTDEQIDVAIENSKKNFDAAGAMQLENARQAYKRGIQPTQGVTPQGIAAAGGGIRGVGVGALNITYNGDLEKATNPAAPAPKQMYDYLVSKGASKNEALMLTGAAASESGFNPAATHDGGIGKGMFGHNGDRLTAMTQAAGTNSPNWQQQADFALSELRSRPESAAVNAAKTTKELVDAQMAFEQPQGYKPGAPEGGHNYTGRYNTLNRFATLAGMAPGPIASPIGFTPQEMAGHPGLASAAVSQYLSDQKVMGQLVNQQVDAMVGMVKQGILAPDAVSIANVQQIAMQHPSLAPKVQELESTVSAARVLQANANSPSPVDGAQLVEQARQIAKANPSIAGYMLYQSMQEQANAQAKQIKDSPLAYAGRVGWSKPPQPLNFDRPETLAGEMASRADAAVRFNSRMGYMPDILQAGEMDQVKQLVDFGSSQQKASFIASLGKLPAPAMMSTLKQLASDSQTLPLAMAAKVSADNPQAAQAIIEGQALLKSDPKLGADKDLREAEWNKALPITDVGNPQIRSAIEEGVNSTYAWLSAQANDMSGAFKKDRYRQALQMVTGGVLDYRGSKVMAPWYGATEGQLTHALNTLTPDDLKGAVTADGAAFPARLLQTQGIGDLIGSGRWRLESAGSQNGKYLIFSGDTTARRYLQNSEIGKPFILDLSQKKTSENVVMPNFIAPPPGALLSKDQIWGADVMRASPDNKVRPLQVSPEIGS